MKRIALALLAIAGLAATSARADRIDIRGSIHLGGPTYAPAPAYYGHPAPVYGSHAPRGYWREVTVPVLIPGHWATRHDAWGRYTRVWVPPCHEYRRQRVWVDAGHPHHRDHHRGHGYGRWNG